MTRFVFLIAVLLCFSGAGFGFAHAGTIICKKVLLPPIVDGDSADAAWEKAQPIVTHDDQADIDIVLRAVYTANEIFFLVDFPDPDESRWHKSWVWDKDREIYKVGVDREDLFVFKWNMRAQPLDLSLKANKPYKSDVWFWKACRTDPVGYADDRMQLLSSVSMKGSSELIDGKGRKMYLLRSVDGGKAAYQTLLPSEYGGYTLPRFKNVLPTGSRSDVKAKGIWRDGNWMVEFGRALNTGNDDDVAFDTKKSYQFGVSRFAIAGRGENFKLSQPRYGTGDVGESIVLIFSR